MTTAMHSLRDAFDTADTSQWVFDDSATTSGGRLRITSVPDQMAGAHSVASYDLRGSEFLVELVSAPAGASATVALHGAGGPSIAGLGFTVSAGQLTEVWRAVQGARETVALLTPDPFAQRWLRIRERVGIVYWDTSPDGLEWFPTGSWLADPALDLSALQVLLAWSDSDVPVVALFDNANVTLGESDPATLTGQLGAPHLAIDVQPDVVTGVFALGVSKLNGPDVLAWSDADPATWLNIVCDVTALNVRRGATRLQGALTRTEAGTCSLTLSDTLGAFDPLTNPNVLHKGAPLRVRAWGYDAAGERWDVVLFTCELDELGVSYRKAESNLVTITGLDVVGPLAAWQAAGHEAPGVGEGDDLLARTARVLEEVGRGEVAPISDQAYVVTLAATPLARPWEELSAAVEAELGRLWADRHNRLVVKNRNSDLSGPVRGTLSDSHGDAPVGVHCCVADAAVVYGVETLANRALAARQGNTGLVVQVDDETSQQRHGVGVIDRRSLALTMDGQVQRWAEAVVATHSTPEVRVDSVQPAPSEVDLDSALTAWPAVLVTDIGDRWLFRFTTSTGRLVERILGVLGIELDVTPDAWLVNWTTTDAPAAGTPATEGWFTLDVSSLGGNDLLIPASLDV